MTSRDRSNRPSFQIEWRIAEEIGDEHQSPAACIYLLTIQQPIDYAGSRDWKFSPPFCSQGFTIVSELFQFSASRKVRIFFFCFILL